MLVMQGKDILEQTEERRSVTKYPTLSLLIDNYVYVSHHPSQF